MWSDILDNSIDNVDDVDVVDASVSGCIDNILYTKTNDYVGHIVDDNYIVSLSGGVDSMVLASILCIISKNRSKRVVALHINYKNRPETDKEERFIKEWCRVNDIILKVYVMDIVRNESDREFYEKETRRQRFDQYRELLSCYNASGVFLAHHRGDEQENTFTNLVNGKNLLSISAMSTTCCINGVNILRPFINDDKKHIYKYAEQYNIPYFKDTTPDWSNRGKLRQKIFPLMTEVYGNKFLTNFTSISKESHEWNTFIHDFIITPFITNNITSMNNEIHIYITMMYPQCIWDLIFKQIGLVVSRKALNTLVTKLSANFSGKIPLNKSTTVMLSKNKMIIL